MSPQPGGGGGGGRWAGLEAIPSRWKETGPTQLHDVFKVPASDKARFRNLLTVRFFLPNHRLTKNYKYMPKNKFLILTQHSRGHSVTNRGLIPVRLQGSAWECSAQWLGGCQIVFFLEGKAYLDRCVH